MERYTNRASGNDVSFVDQQESCDNGLQDLRLSSSPVGGALLRKDTIPE